MKICTQSAVFGRGALAAAALLALGGSSSAAEFVVSNTNDNGAGSFREAVALANNTTGDDTITFDPTVFNIAREIPIVARIDITESVAIQGPGRTLLTLVTALGGYSQAEQIRVTAGTVSFEGLAMRSGAGDTVRLVRAINANLVIRDVDMLGNGSSIAAISGGAVVVQGGDLVMQDCLVQDFATEHRGGAVFVLNAEAHAAMIERCAFVGNSVTGTTTIDYPKSGGALFVQDTSPQAPGTKVEIVDSEFSGNTAENGGAIGLHDLANLTLQNSTLSGNVARDKGGAIYAVKESAAVFNPVTYIETSTITDNEAGFGGGIYFDTEASRALGVNNSVIAGNRATFVDPQVPNRNVYQEIFKDGDIVASYSLFGDEAGDVEQLNIVEHQSAIGSVMTETNPMLAALANNGGATWTHALRSGSPLIDAGSASASPRDQQLVFPGNDQRGTGFSRDRGAAPDIGAFEAAPAGGGPGPGPGGGGSSGGGGTSWLLLLALLLVVVMRANRPMQANLLASGDDGAR